MTEKSLRSGSRVRIVLALIVLSLAIAFLEKTGSLDFFKAFSGRIFTPIQLSLYHTYQNVSEFSAGFFAIGSLRQRNVDLEVENAALKSENSELASLEKENQDLKAQLGIGDIRVKIEQAAAVIGFGTSGNRNSFLINKGKLDKLKSGDLVVYKNLYIGKIVDPTPTTSRVQLINDSATKIPAVTSNNALGVVVGQFGTESHLTNVIQDDKLSQGDLVFTSGEADFPKGLVIGKIVSVNKISRELFQDATIEPLVDLAQLTTVFVVEGK